MKSKYLSCLKCEGVQMDWEDSHDQEMSLHTYVCPLCDLTVTINWKIDDKRERAIKEK